MDRRDKSKTPPRKRMILEVVATDLFLSILFLTDFSLVLHFASARVTTGSMRQRLQPTQGAQVAQLLQDGTSIRAMVRRFAVSPSTVSRV